MKADSIRSIVTFARNPIILRGTWPDTEPDPRGGSFTVAVGGAVVYTGRFTPPCGTDLREIAEAAAGHFPDVPDGNDVPLVSFGPSEISSRALVADFEFGGVTDQWRTTLVPGGIPDGMFRRLAEAGTDIFAARFLNRATNFFLTVRSAARVFRIRETELCPLYFLVNEGVMRISDPLSGKALDFPLGDEDPGVHALDIRALRHRFATSLGTLPSVFDISVGGVASCRVVVEKSEPARDRHRIRFRNSLGVSEIIEATGMLKAAVSMPEDSTFETYDAVTDGFDGRNARRALKTAWTLETGPERPDDIRMILDMLASDEVWLLDARDTPVRVIPSVENMSFAHRQDAPESFSLTLTECRGSDGVYPDDGDTAARRRLFSTVFDNHFN